MLLEKKATKLYFYFGLFCICIHDHRPLFSFCFLVTNKQAKVLFVFKKINSNSQLCADLHVCTLSGNWEMRQMWLEVRDKNFLVLHTDALR